MQKVVGYGTALFTVGLIVLAIWFSGAGLSEAGIVSLGMALAMLLVTTMMLRSKGDRT